MPSKMLKTCLKSVENLSGAQSGDNGLIDSVGVLAYDHDDGPVLEGLELGVFGDLILIGKVVLKVLALGVDSALEAGLDRLLAALGGLDDHDAVGLDVYE